MLRPNFEDPIDTADQIIEKNLKPHTIWGASLIIYLFSIHQDPALQKLSKLLYVPKNDIEYFNMSKHVIEEGKSVNIFSHLTPEEKKMGIWYRSKERVDIPMGYITPYIGWISRKKWHLNEEYLLKTFGYVSLRFKIVVNIGMKPMKRQIFK